MEISELPLCKFPTEAVVVDDNISFTKSLQMVAAQKGVRIKVFNDPRKALRYLLDKSYGGFLQKYVSSVNHAIEVSNKVLDVDLRSTYTELYNKNRFDEVSTLVVDYAMPSMNGHEFCEQLKHLPLQKVLLTGEASFENAVGMFNVGEINRFIRKDQDDMVDSFFSMVEELQYHYFLKITTMLRSVIPQDGAQVFHDAKFIQFFNELCQQQHIVEYYAVDDTGSYLLVDKHGQLKLLVVKSDDDMTVLYEIAEGDRNVPKGLLESLQQRKKITFFQTEENLAVPAAMWNMYDAQRLDGEHQTYYYALADVGHDFHIEQKKIVSYECYLQ